MIVNTADQSQARDGLHNPKPNPIPDRNYEPFYIEISRVHRRE